MTTLNLTSPDRHTSSASTKRATNDLYGQTMMFQGLAQVVVRNLEQFLDSFQGGGLMAPALASMTRQEYFSTFLQVANRLMNETCESVAALLRSSSRSAVIHQTDPSELAKRIRSHAFDSLDRILVNYTQSAKKTGVICGNIRKIEEELKREAAPEGAKVEATQQTDRPAENWATKEELQRQHELLLGVQSQAFSQITEYLKHIEVLPEVVLEYSAEKCFPGEVNYELVREQVTEVKPVIQRKLAMAFDALAGANSAGLEQVRQERTRILANIELEKAQVAIEEIVEKRFETKELSRKRFKKIALLTFTVMALVAAMSIWFLLRKL